MKIEKTNSLSIFLPLLFGGQICVISLPVGYKTAQEGGIGDRGPVTSIQERCFRGFQCFCFAKKENMELQCIVYGCNNKKRREKGEFTSTKFPSTVIKDRKP